MLGSFGIVPTETFKRTVCFKFRLLQNGADHLHGLHCAQVSNLPAERTCLNLLNRGQEGIHLPKQAKKVRSKGLKKPFVHVP